MSQCFIIYFYNKKFYIIRDYDILYYYYHQQFIAAIHHIKNI